MNIKNQTVKMLIMALLTAILIIMAVTPLGYLNIGPLAITFNMIPVAIGAILMGPGGGAFLGCVFGLTSFSQALGILGASAFSSMLLSINPVFTFILCIVPRVLDGLLIGFVYNFMSSKFKNKSVSYAVTGFLSAALNTAFFMTTLVLLFGRTDYVQDIWNDLAPGSNVIVFIAVFVGVNAIVEMISATVMTTAIALALSKARLTGIAKVRV